MQLVMLDLFQHLIKSVCFVTLKQVQGNIPRVLRQAPPADFYYYLRSLFISQLTNNHFTAKDDINQILIFLKFFP
jgi:hypothetical protein